MGTIVRTNEQATTLAVNSVSAACLPSQPAVHRSVIQLVSQNTTTKAIANTTSITVCVTRNSSKPNSDRSNNKVDTACEACAAVSTCCISGVSWKPSKVTVASIRITNAMNDKRTGREVMRPAPNGRKLI